MPELKRYSLKEVAEHKTATSCWVIIHDKVYDVTPFFNEVSSQNTISIDIDSE